MKITAVETLRVGMFGHNIWVQLHTDEGLVGLGETYYAVSAVEAYLHDIAAPKLLGQDPIQIEARNASLIPHLGWGASGVETRANSAVDIALWDLFGKAVGRPLCEALGGKTRDSIRVYNTCAGDDYMRQGDPARAPDSPSLRGKYEDLDLFLNDAGTLAQSLLEQGITGMKIWPFDEAAKRNAGWNITPAELDQALEPFRKIRRAVGNKMDIMVEFHYLWSLPMAKKLAERLAEFDTYWHEDPFRPDNVSDFADYARHSKAWVCASETLAYTHGFRDFLTSGVAGVVMLDIAWCGGLSEARKIAGMAEAWHTPVAPHDCTGPVTYAASCHFALHARNALIQESVRAFYDGWYPQTAIGIPVVRGGAVTVSDAPGLGMELLPDLHKRKDATVRITRQS